MISLRYENDTLSDVRNWSVEPGFPADELISTFGRDANGEVYVAAYLTSRVYRLDPR